MIVLTSFYAKLHWEKQTWTITTTEFRQYSSCFYNPFMLSGTSVRYKPHVLYSMCRTSHTHTRRGARTRVPISTSSVQGHENKSIMHLIGLMRLSLIGLKCKYFFPFNNCLLCFTSCLRVDKNDWSVVILGHLWAYSDLWLKKNVDGGVKQGGPPTSSTLASNFLTWCLRFPVFLCVFFFLKLWHISLKLKSKKNNEQEFESPTLRNSYSWVKHE